MNYLQLCQRLRQEVGGSGEGPPSVLSQLGENKLYVTWINQAWREIQNYRADWDFHWTQLSTTITTGASTVTLPADFRVFDGDSLHIDGFDVKQIDWDDMRTIQRGTLNTTRPNACSLAPNGTLFFNAIADQDYTLQGEYFATPQDLAANTDIPTLPERFHLIIVYKAMLYYGAYENANEVLGFAQVQFQQMLGDMAQDVQPPVYMAGPLA